MDADRIIWSWRGVLCGPGGTSQNGAGCCAPFESGDPLGPFGGVGFPLGKANAIFYMVALNHVDGMFRGQK